MKNKETLEDGFCNNCNNDVCCCIIRTQETLEEVAERYYEDEVSINAFINGYKLAQEQTCNHTYILTSEQGNRVIKCSKCNDTQPI